MTPNPPDTVLGPAGHVGLGHDQAAPPHRGLREVIEEALGDALGEVPGTGGGRPALATRSYVVDPPFYGDGDIGGLAVCGTVNALATAGARPLAVTLSAIIEAGTPLEHLRRMAGSARQAALDAGVVVCSVDTRVVRAGEADQIYLNATGFGAYEQPALDTAGVRPGDRVVLTSPLGAHAAHVLSVRQGLGWETILTSTSAPLAGLLDDARAAAAPGALRAAHALGPVSLATILRTCAHAAGVDLRVRREDLPVTHETHITLQALHLDPLHASGDTGLCLFVAPEALDTVLAAVRRHPHGEHAAVIGEAVPAAASAPAVHLQDADGATVLEPDHSTPTRLT